MARISIVDLEVFFNVGVTDEERAQPQRLLISVDMTADIAQAAVSDRVEKTINYFEVVQEIIRYGEGRSWKLLERLASNVADLILTKFKPDDVTIEVKKFIIPQTRYVSVTLAQRR
ncbi:MAG TPA: dihydroneopterin aldolase [Verrucomicrobiae bacterium]|nr:dihydroneopterin aldolase [Verrucomicrobiae bacterium]